jgi:hypothetical protein
MEHDPRRSSPRIGLEALCWEVVGNHELQSMVVDLSSEGARLQRPYLSAATDDNGPIELGPAGKSRYVPRPRIPERRDRVIPLQLEIPEIDEVMWARGDVVFDEVVPVKTHGGPFGLMRRTGVHISLAAGRDMRLLRDYVYDMPERQLAATRVAANDESVDWLRCFG